MQKAAVRSQDHLSGDTWCKGARADAVLDIQAKANSPSNRNSARKPP